MNWLREHDDWLIQRFIDTDISDPVLLAEILRFCENCETLTQILRESGQRALAGEATSVRRKWLIRLAFYAGPLPQLAKEDLPVELMAELTALGLCDATRPQYQRLDLSDDQVRHNLYRVLSLSSIDVDLDDLILSTLSSAGQNPAVQELTAEVKLGGYVRLSHQTQGFWSWHLRIATPDHLDVPPIELTEDELPPDIGRWLLDFMHAVERRKAA